MTLCSVTVHAVHSQNQVCIHALLILAFVYLAPSGSPANVRQRALNSTAVLLSWIEPPYYQRNGIIRHYEVRVCQIEPEGQCEDHKAKAIGTSLELSLHPHYRYSWTVAAYTVARGPYSQSLPPFQMPEDSKCMVSVLIIARKKCVY